MVVAAKLRKVVKLCEQHIGFQVRESTTDASGNVRGTCRVRKMEMERQKSMSGWSRTRFRA